MLQSRRGVVHVLLGAVHVHVVMTNHEVKVPGKRPPKLFDRALKSVQFSQGRFKVSGE